MKPTTLFRSRPAFAAKQKGVVLFFALIALLAMSLAAVALVRSVDTSTIIAGNLALKQSATTSGDAGLEAASAFLLQMQMASGGLSAVNDAAHPFNVDAPAAGYYSSVNPATNPITGIGWTNADSAPVNPDGTGEPSADSAGNKTRYVIHRMCRNPNVAIKDTNCLFATPPSTKNESGVKSSTEECVGCTPPTATPLLRVTTRTVGLRNTISYLQVFVY
jgi:Tfp pilus assembly protein PilX